MTEKETDELCQKIQKASWTCIWGGLSILFMATIGFWLLVFVMALFK